MIKRIKQSLKKSKELKRISAKLTKPLEAINFMEFAFNELQKSDNENVNLEFKPESYVGRILAKPVFKDRIEGFTDETTGKYISKEEIDELRAKNLSGVTEEEFNILREELFPEGTELTTSIIENIKKTGYSWVSLYKINKPEKSEKVDVIDELLALAESDENTQKIINEYSANRDILRKIYNKLVLTGAGQFVKGHYVAASSLVYPQTLRFLLRYFNGKNFSVNDWTERESEIFIAFRLIEYFKKGEVGEISIT